MAKRGAILRLPHRAHPRLPIPGGRRQGGQSGGVPRGSSAQSRPGPLSGPHALRPRPCSAFFSAPSRCCTPRSPTTTSATTSTRSSRYLGKSSEESFEESSDRRPLSPPFERRERPPIAALLRAASMLLVLAYTRGRAAGAGTAAWPLRMPAPTLLAPPHPRHRRQSFPAPRRPALPRPPQALDFCHSKGIMHRDVKPHNVRAVGALRCAALWLSRRGAGRGGGWRESAYGKWCGLWTVASCVTGGRASAWGSHDAEGPAWGISPAAQGNRSFTGGAQSAGKRMNQGPGLALQVRGSQGPLPPSSPWDDPPPFSLLLMPRWDGSLLPPPPTPHTVRSRCANAVRPRCALHATLCRS